MPYLARACRAQWHHATLACKFCILLSAALVLYTPMCAIQAVCSCPHPFCSMPPLVLAWRPVMVPVHPVIRVLVPPCSRRTSTNLITSFATTRATWITGALPCVLPALFPTGACWPHASTVAASHTAFAKGWAACINCGIQCTHQSIALPHACSCGQAHPPAAALHRPRRISPHAPQRTHARLTAPS